MINDSLRNDLDELFTEAEKKTLAGLDYDQTWNLLDGNNYTEKVKEYYAEKVENDFYWDKIPSLFETEGELMNEEEFKAGYEDTLVKCIYAGSCLNIYPSGKFYMPFACSNITMGFEAIADELYREALDAKLDALGYWQEAGQGDGLDVFFCQAIETDDDDDDDNDDAGNYYTMELDRINADADTVTAKITDYDGNATKHFNLDTLEAIEALQHFIRKRLDFIRLDRNGQE